jgi:hypothetical protein
VVFGYLVIHTARWKFLEGKDLRICLRVIESLRAYHGRNCHFRTFCVVCHSFLLVVLVGDNLMYLMSFYCISLVAKEDEVSEVFRTF